MLAICTNKVRPSVHSGRRFGNQWWARDIYHQKMEGVNKTLCGLSCRDWCIIGELGPLEIMSENYCKRCAAKGNHG